MATKPMKKTKRNRSFGYLQLSKPPPENKEQRAALRELGKIMLEGDEDKFMEAFLEYVKRYNSVDEVRQEIPGTPMVYMSLTAVGSVVERDSPAGAN